MTHLSIRRWLEEHTPIEPSLLDSAGLDMLIAERLEAMGSPGEPAYIAELVRSPDEVDRLLAAVAVPETWFFRYPRSYDLLLEFLRRRLASGATALRMLSVGCAMGQEPYGMAMTALEAGWTADRVHIEGLDRNAEFLRAAAVARYGAGSIRTEIPPWAVRFLRRSGDTFAVDPAVCAMVRFTRADVTEVAVMGGTGPWDVVFCRNLLIYLNAAARARLLESIVAQLAPGGLLFVGHAEQVMRGALPLRAVSSPHAFALELVDEKTAVTHRPPAARSAFTHTFAPPALSIARPTPPPTSTPSPTARPEPGPHPENSVEDARAMADAGHTREAEVMIRAIIARRGPSASAMELLGMIRMCQNDSGGARRLFEQAVYLEPARSASLLQLALISERAGESGRAASYWERARRASAGGRAEPAR